MNLREILDKYRIESLSEREKGYRFEKLMANFLMTYPVYDGVLGQVCLWREWPLKDQISSQDIGIDLVAETIDGKYWAVQCKCYAPTAAISKNMIDSFLGVTGKKFQDSSGQWIGFANRLWISTTNNWTDVAEIEILNQDIGFQRISLSQLETAAVDWAKLDQGFLGSYARAKKKTILDHQKIALEKFHAHFQTQERGQLIMACGTGKTFTSLKIAEQETSNQGLILFLAPSLALIAQTLKEWSADAAETLSSIVVCSDADVSRVTATSKIKRINSEDLVANSTVDLALPATTKPDKIVERLTDAKERKPFQRRVIFSTYQSIDKVAEALKLADLTVDLIVCDEAHRSTGAIFDQNDKSYFIKVHDNDFIRAKKRLYMTATPRIYAESAKRKAEDYSVALCSMDDESLFGPEVYRLGFGESVNRNLLSDYKVLVLTIPRQAISQKIQAEIDEGKKEIDADDITKLIGCLNALSKNMTVESRVLRQVDPEPMRRAVAFCQTIAKSKAIVEVFNQLKDKYCRQMVEVESTNLVDIVAEHIDGSMGSSLRDKKMAWLRDSNASPESCRLLGNVRCLSEGVDVPSLDAVLFLSAKNSQIEVVQSVGRVMRKAEGKKFGYIVIPVIVPSYVDPEDALNDNERFKVVWAVLNALKAHDDRFNALINKIQFNKKIPTEGGSILIGGIAGSSNVADYKVSTPDIFSGVMGGDEGYYRALYATMVKKVGFKQDTLLWATDVAKIAEGFKKRIATVVSQEGPHKKEFDHFLTGLRSALNPSISTNDAIDTLSQHLITKPVFEALFENHSFVASNPVSKSLEAIVAVLEDQGLEQDKVTLSRFYQRVKDEVAGIDAPEARQKIIVKLYDNFFKIATPGTVEKLGIVYTPIEIVDFINNSVAKTLEKEFGFNITDPNIHILDPFTGTGTFIARLIQSGLLGQGEILTRQYLKNLHANEIVLLAYYIASINIENAYHEILGEKSDYKHFQGICLADTFQLFEQIDHISKVENLKGNNDMVNAQIDTQIMCIIGNPPYSVGQRDANKNAQNQPYPHLEQRVRETYAHFSTANNKNSLYDTYIKAIRWATDRLDESQGGVIGFVTNAGWLDGNAMDGLRKCLVNDFSSLYVFNLRGNQRTSGETSRKEGGKIFGSGSRAPIAISVLIKNPAETGPAKIYYNDIGDYLTRTQKLAIIAERGDIYSPDMDWETITPNDAGDWVNQRTDIFRNFTPIGNKDDKYCQNFFYNYYGRGLETTRDVWCYNSSNKILNNLVISTLDFYNKQRIFVLEEKQKNNNKNIDIDKLITYDSTRISWSYKFINELKTNKEKQYDSNSFRYSIYRPFYKQHVYFNRDLNNVVGNLDKIFPTINHHNQVICVAGVGVTKDFSCIITDIIPDLELAGKSQCFPRYYYEPFNQKQGDLFTKVVEGYVRYDTITDFIFKECHLKYSQNVTKDQIFYYVYGLLHSKDYRETFAADLKKMLPRLPLVDDPADFESFYTAGQTLAKLHADYETVNPYDKVEITGLEKDNFHVDKIRFAKINAKDDLTTIIYNQYITIKNIPLEAYDYVVNGRSAIAWLLDRYRVTIDKDSGVKNDPNDWAKEHNSPRYILDLILRIITVSLETINIVNNLPRLNF
ncbi:MAG: DEAD/DEAH box helicase family protein [Deltaproteobacteria bacterium]|jgi:predicted helicase|nr:DEAD/DEAH box helicase family protein [Deltaproteobacteria bacterium]